MSVINLHPHYYCLYIKNRHGEEQMYLEVGPSSKSSKYRLDIFEDKETLDRWVKQEQEVQAHNDRWGMHAIYDRLYAKDISLIEFAKLMKEREDIDSITFVDRNGVRRLYFRTDFDEYGYDTFPISNQKIHPKEPIYIINRQRALDEQTILQKEAYFTTYPVIATPLFSAGIKEWAEDLISRKPDQGYYIEQTTLYDVYMRTTLERKDPGFFILSREESPHYILRKSDLKKIIEGRFN